MRVDIITLFPELIQSFLEVGVTRRAYESGQVAVHCWNPRDYADGNYRRVDDRPFGGGPGMVMLAEPLAACIDAHVDLQISLGDFVLSGGELAAMAWLDAVARLQPGVLQDEQSHLQDSFTPALSGLLDCPHYTRPEAWRGQGVPAPLLSGHHAQIAEWRRAQSLALTVEKRPDLIDQARQQGLLKPQDEQFLKTLT